VEGDSAEQHCGELSQKPSDYNSSFQKGPHACKHNRVDGLQRCSPVGREMFEAGVLLRPEVLHGGLEGRVVAGHDVLLSLQGMLPLLPLPACAAYLGPPLAQRLLHPSVRHHSIRAMMCALQGILLLCLALHNLTSLVLYYLDDSCGSSTMLCMGDSQSSRYGEQLPACNCRLSLCKIGF
jgi:hypothetical protein